MMHGSCRALIKDYCANCTFAGIHFIADETKHWIERLLWLVLVVLSWYGSALLIIAAWDAFVTSPISFGVETTYLKWETKMPAVAVCETSNDEKIYAVSDEIWPAGHLLDLEDCLKDIAYFRGVSYSLVDVCYAAKNPDPLCPTGNFSYYVNKVRSDCEQIMKNCSYNDNEFSCCEYFQPIDTDFGVCFIINSIQTKFNMKLWKSTSRKPNPYPMISNLKNKQAVLKFEIWIGATMYTLGEDEVPSITSLQSSTLRIQLGHHYRRQVTVRNIENDPLIVDNTPEQRACRFYSENEGGIYPQYSYSACTVQCRKKGQLDRCGCNDHFMIGARYYYTGAMIPMCQSRQGASEYGAVRPHATQAAEIFGHPSPTALDQQYLKAPTGRRSIAEQQRCNLSGLACLHQYYMHLTTLKPEWDTTPGLACNCMPSCDETEITVIKDNDNTIKGKANKKKARVEVILAYLATERFKRSVVRSQMDLVVSVGGTTGLFVGASLLSFVELIFFFTVRYMSNILMDRRRSQRAQRNATAVITADEPRISNPEEFITDNTLTTIKRRYVKSKLVLGKADYPTNNFLLR